MNLFRKLYLSRYSHVALKQHNHMTQSLLLDMINTQGEADPE